jgi:hypothetical protein
MMRNARTHSCAFPQENTFMAKAYEAPAGVEIAALKNKKTTGPMDLMMPGDGTPWEDRGNLGLPKAFIQTAVAGITKPARLLDHIRRPDTSGEATQFAIGCSVLWAISAFIHMLLWHWRHPIPVEWEQEGTYYVKSIVASILAGLAAYVLGVMFASRMFRAMVSTELKNNAPPVLLHNIFCYCLGPSLLALIPLAGPPLAVVFILIAWSSAGAKRLYVSWRGAIVASVLSMLISLVVVGVGAFVLNVMISASEPDYIREQREQQEEMHRQAMPGGGGGGGKVQP